MEECALLLLSMRFETDTEAVQPLLDFTIFPFDIGRAKVTDPQAGKTAYRLFKKSGFHIADELPLSNAHLQYRVEAHLHRFWRDYARIENRFKILKGTLEGIGIQFEKTSCKTGVAQKQIHLSATG
jgi:hypothetical protein